MAIRSLGAKSALKPNITDGVNMTESNMNMRPGFGGETPGPVQSRYESRGAQAAVGASGHLRRLRRWIAAGCLGLAVCGSTGCTLTSGVCNALNQSDCIDDFMISYRNKALAEKAWHCNKHHFGDRRFGKEFKDGFIQGYIDVASGGNGCTPAVAPSQYWGWRYQSSQGQGAINAWFEGFPQGVKAAEQDGVGHWRQVNSFGSVPVAGPAPLAPAMHEPNVANPFYSEPEIIPTPMNPEIDHSGMNPPIMDDSGFDDFETTIDGAQVEFPLVVKSDSNETELISQHHAAVEARMADQPVHADINEMFNSPSKPVVSTETDSGELPFSFE